MALAVESGERMLECLDRSSVSGAVLPVHEHRTASAIELLDQSVDIVRQGARNTPHFGRLRWKHGVILLHPG
jgi:hypothetical protein